MGDSCLATTEPGHGAHVYSTATCAASQLRSDEQSLATGGPHAQLMCASKSPADPVLVKFSLRVRVAPGERLVHHHPAEPDMVAQRSLRTLLSVRSSIVRCRGGQARRGCHHPAELSLSPRVHASSNYAGGVHLQLQQQFDHDIPLDSIPYPMAARRLKRGSCARRRETQRFVSASASTAASAATTHESCRPSNMRVLGSRRARVDYHVSLTASLLPPRPLVFIRPFQPVHINGCYVLSVPNLIVTCISMRL